MYNKIMKLISNFLKPNKKKIILTILIVISPAVLGYIPQFVPKIIWDAPNEFGFGIFLILYAILTFPVVPLGLDINLGPLMPLVILNAYILASLFYSIFVSIRRRKNSNIV